jgi:hypothetical protein
MMLCGLLVEPPLVIDNVFQTKLGFSKVAFYAQNLKKKRNYADKSHVWLKNLIFSEKPSNVTRSAQLHYLDEIYSHIKVH